MGKGWSGDTFRQGRGLEDKYCVFFFGHLPAEIFKAISLCAFCRGCLKENDLSTVTGRGVDRTYIIGMKLYVYKYKCSYKHRYKYKYIYE